MILSQFSRSIAVSVLVAAFTGCSKSDSDAIPPNVEKAGDGEKQEISITTPPAPSQKAELVVQMIIGVLSGAESQHDQRVAPVRLGIEFKPDPSGANDPMRGAFEIVDSAIDGKDASPELYKQWKEDFGKFDPKGFKGSYTADAFGRILDADVTLPRSVPSTVRQLLQTVRSSFELFSIPRPSAAIGTGAVLRDRRVVTLSGMKLDLEGTYTLLASDEKELTFGADLTLNGHPQAIDLPSAKDDTSKAQLLSASATARGKIVVSRHSIAPLTGELHVPVEMEVGMVYQGKETRLKSTIDLTLTLQRRPDR